MRKYPREYNGWQILLKCGQEQIVLTVKKVIDPVVQKHNELRSRRNANEEEIITVDDIFKRYFIYPAPAILQREMLKCGRTWTIMSEKPKDEGLCKRETLRRL